MDLDRKKRTCEYCDKEFSTTSARNKHLLKFHGESTSAQSILDKKSKSHNHTICPICTNEEKFTNYDLLNKHLTNIHNIIIKQSVLSFSNLEEFKTWKSEGNREVDYACYNRYKLPNGNENIYYICNRSNYKGHSSTAQKRKSKVAGSIHIHGVCPSRYIVKVDANGPVTVTFIETHVGHDDELRNKRLTKIEEETIVTKLKSGISNERIISDARKIENKPLTRANLITGVDLANLIRKHNIDKKRHKDYMIATTIKIEEGNNKPFLTEEQKREIENEEIFGKIKSLQGQDFDRFKEYFKNFDWESCSNSSNQPSKRRKIDKQTYYPNKKDCNC